MPAGPSEVLVIADRDANPELTGQYAVVKLYGR
jgi:histidinol dehydrogenase